MVAAIAILAAGCSSGSSSTAAATSASSDGSGAVSGGKAGGATYVSGTPLSNQLTTATITDPSLGNIVAATLTIPAGWKLQGIEMISPCTFLPWPVFRSYSPDGLMQYRIEPVFGWQWHPNAKGPLNSGGANISGQMSGGEIFCSITWGTVQGGVHVVGTMTGSRCLFAVGAGLAAQKNQGNSRAPAAMQRRRTTADTAALRIEVVNGSFVVEERLRTVVECR